MALEDECHPLCRRFKLKNFFAGIPQAKSPSFSSCFKGHCIASYFILFSTIETWLRPAISHQDTSHQDSYHSWTTPTPSSASKLHQFLRGFSYPICRHICVTPDLKGWTFTPKTHRVSPPFSAQGLSRSRSTSQSSPKVSWQVRCHSHLNLLDLDTATVWCWRGRYTATSSCCPWWG